MSTANYSSESEALMAAGQIVESVAYDRAGYWARSRVAQLMLIAAELQRISQECAPAASEPETLM